MGKRSKVAKKTMSPACLPKVAVVMDLNTPNRPKIGARRAAKKETSSGGATSTTSSYEAFSKGYICTANAKSSVGNAFATSRVIRLRAGGEAPGRMFAFSHTPSARMVAITEEGGSNADHNTLKLSSKAGTAEPPSTNERNTLRACSAAIRPLTAATNKVDKEFRLSERRRDPSEAPESIAISSRSPLPSGASSGRSTVSTSATCPAGRPKRLDTATRKASVNELFSKNTEP
mmetsp:Transcript_41799/g.132150  ORF Transcript_41799/g.132150 Transcript_41799/m.132150 type:complete len:232 (-) Transcript_41799:1471-2166(-)